ncbi:MAG: hypothetical protein KAS78_04985 [Candidatus Pacebacteria bacterium]|nr:hypothetical protein [Candidatus Paceibacterota bacterium]
MEIAIIETETNPKNSNQMYFELKDSIVLNAHIEEAIKKACRGIENILGVKMLMIRKKLVGITITSCGGWKSEDFITTVSDEAVKAIKSKM